MNIHLKIHLASPSCRSDSPAKSCCQRSVAHWVIFQHSGVCKWTGQHASTENKPHQPSGGLTDPASTDEERLQSHLPRLLLWKHLGHVTVQDPGLQTPKGAGSVHVVAAPGACAGPCSSGQRTAQPQPSPEHAPCSGTAVSTSMDTQGVTRDPGPASLRSTRAQGNARL